MSRLAGLEFGLTLNASARTDLVFPLGGHNFSVGSRNVDSGICITD